MEGLHFLYHCSLFISIFLSGVVNSLSIYSSFVGMPGVLFVLPDSYVDPEYKDYGGTSIVT